MKLFKTDTAILLESDGRVYNPGISDWDELINLDNLVTFLKEVIHTTRPLGDAQYLDNLSLSVPIGTQEVWAAGVTYLRSKIARMEESEVAGGDSFYDKVYDAERPELFFKSNAHRVVSTKSFVHIRKDSTWDVPEPELTLVINHKGKIVGYTIGNDMSSRSIEGENPLYLPQAKVYNGSTSIGPCVLVKEDNPISPETLISIEISRGGTSVYTGEAPVSQMKRTHEELVSWLFKELDFPFGACLMTGTCLVPEKGFTLQPGDQIKIEIAGIGVLENTVG